MRTGNLFVLLCLMTLTLGEERTTESRSAKNLGEKYEHVGNAKTKDSDSNDGGENALGNRNDRAIDAHSAPSKSDKQFTRSNLPKSKLKSSGKGHQKGHLFKNMTIANGICQSIDIRNSVDYFTMLQGCVVIEGFLQIVLIEPKKKELSANVDVIVDFQNVSFPLLREITGYLVLYRVNGLKSLSNLFPNLEVIRGETLLTDYSFMVYEMPHLQEIGLKKLTKITRGAVRIEKNAALCFTKTIDWDAIVVAGENVIKDNSNEASCPGCPKCPTGYCWTAKDCQDQIENKCHEQCLGDCSGPTASDCFVCKHYRHEGKCVDSCPPHLYTYLSRRCITKEECLNINILLNAIKNEHGQKFWPFNGLCTIQCPDGYEDFIDENNKTTCRACKGSCRKIGPGAIIRHISDAQPFRGITIVKGSLEFQIRNGNPSIMDELTKSFGQIEEITGHLKVAHSFPLTSLHFLKKLKVIKGAPTDLNNSSFVVLDNPNLASLFAKGQRIEILHGRLFFHYNPKLCLTKIVEFGKMVGITNLSALEVQPESNGEKVACDVTDIAINVKERSSSDVTLIWQRYEPRGGQRLLSYLLNYMETDNRNITYEANSCGSNNWQIIDVDIPDSSSRSKTISKRIPNLKPYTRYAVYVKTFAARNPKSVISPVGQSKIIFFRTMSDVPTKPTDVASTPVSDSKISVTWNPPEYPNGPIGYYVLSGFIREDDAEILSSRDYCSDGLVAEQEAEQPQEVTVKTTIVELETCCKKDVVQKTSSKKFEIFCHENITLSHLSPGRKDYCLSSRYNGGDTELVNLDSKFINPRIPVNEPTGNGISPVMDGSKTRFRNGTYYSFVFNVSAESNSYLLDKLRHYSLYTIAVAACGGYELHNATVKCSSIQYTNTRTLRRPSADDVRNVRVQVSNDTIVIVSWDPAREPNSLTVAYTVEYTNLDVKDAKKSTECVPEKTYREKRGTYSIKNLSPGRYGLRVRSMSLAGDGNFSGQVRFSIGLKENNSMIIAVLLVLACVSAIAIAVFVVSRRRQRKKKQARLIASVNPDYIETTYVVDSWEVARENVEILEELGLGNFGMVYRGRLNANQEVAIKTISETASQREKNEFLNEASVMKNFSTFHIIKLLGVVSKGNPPFVIMELMENGDLKTYLRRIRDTHLVPNATRIVRMAAEIADGMSYLESKKFVHRDLAARNCMVSKDLVCKIGDFGMARDIYETDYYKVGKKGLLPIRWMAPENLSDGVFTSDSDVWSYGVVLYEILTLAEIPYQGFSNEEVLNYVLRKGLLTIPRNCPENIYKIMEKCFKWRPSERPTFMEIVAELEPFLGQDFCENSFYHSAEGVEIRNLGIKKIYHHAAPIRFHWGNETARWVREFEDNVTLLDQTKAGTSRGRIFKNGFQPFGNVTNLEDVPLDR